MTELLWEDPPSRYPKPERNGRNRSQAPQADEHVELLQGNPGRWAKVLSGVASPNRAKAYKTRGCKTAQRGKRGGPYDIYAMWPTPEDSEDS